ncbi:cell surface protein SprA [candidate division KSB1 bacterium]
MFESKGVREIKPQLGREPSRTMVGDIDGAIRLQPRLFTDLVNRIPFVQTDRPSDFNLSGEMAVSIPNPNTSDNGSAYVDDMEGSRQADNLATTRRAWHMGSKPEHSNDAAHVLRWFNIPRGYQKKYIYPDLPEDEQEEAVHVLNIQYMPFGMAYSEANFTEVDSLDYYPAIVRSLSKEGTDYSEREFIEVLVRGEVGRINIDLGDVSEDSFQPGQSNIPDTEDRNLDGRLDNGEDTGLDGVIAPDHLLEVGDTGKDDYPASEINDLQDVKNLSQFLKRANGLNWNGLEGNQGELPDTEDINANGNLDTKTEYFEYSFSLTDEPEEHYLDNWKLYRLPLSRPSRTVGNPRVDRKRVKYVRIWFEDIPDTTFIQIGSLEVVGNRWIKQRSLTATDAMPDSNFIVTVKNSKDHPESYAVPGGILMNMDYRGRTGKEQSLVLKANELPPDSTGLAFQPLYNAQNYTVYQSLSFLLYAYTDVKPDSVEFILRLESDEFNYYEYRQMMVFETAVTRELWQRLRLYFEDLTRLKGDDPDTTRWRFIEAESEEGHKVFQGRRIEDEHRRVIIAGAPSLTKIWRLTAGVYNPSETETISGEIWLNEVRLTDVRKDIGAASRLTLNTSFSDFGTFNVNARSQDENFHSLGQDVGTGRNSLNYNLRSSLNANKFFPEEWGLAIPLSFSASSNRTRPKFSTGSDEILTETQSLNQRTETANQDLSVSFAKRRKADDLLTRLLIDNVQFRASYSRRGTIGPTQADSTVRKSGSVTYDSNINTPPKLKLYKDFGINLLPSSFRYSLGFDETERTHYDVDIRTQERKFKPLEPNRELRGDMSVRYELFRSLRTNYTLNTTRDIRNHTSLNQFKLSTDLDKLKLGREVRRSQNASVDYNPAFSKLFQPTFNYSARYNEDHSLTLPGVTDSTDARNADVATRAQVRATVRISELVRFITGTAGPDRRKQSIDRQKQLLERRRRREAGSSQPEGAEQEKPAEKPEEKPKEKKPEEDGKPFWGLRAIGRVSDVIEPIQGSVSRDGASRFNGVPDRPDLKYQLGFDPAGGDSIFKLRETTSDQVSFNGGLSPLTNLKVTGRLQWRQADSEQNKNVTRETSLSWPDLNFNLTQLERFALIKTVARTFNIVSAYQVRETRRGDVNLGEYVEKRFENNVQWSPLIRIQITWRNRLVTHFAHSHSVATAYQYIDGEVNNKRVTDKISYNGTTSYAFNAPKGVTLLGRTLKFKSNLDIGLDFDYQRSVGTHEPKGKPKDINQDKTTWTLTPKIAYNFSNAIRGGLDLRLETTRDKKSPLYDQRTIGMRVWTQFSFNTAQAGGMPGVY